MRSARTTVGVECVCMCVSVSVESIDKHWALNLKDPWSYNIFMGGVAQYSWAISEMPVLEIMYSFLWRHVVQVRGFNKLIHISGLCYQHKHRSGLGWSFTVKLVLNTWLHHPLTMFGILGFLRYVFYRFIGPYSSWLWNHITSNRSFLHSCNKRHNGLCRIG